MREYGQSNPGVMHNALVNGTAKIYGLRGHIDVSIMPGLGLIRRVFARRHTTAIETQSRERGSELMVPAGVIRNTLCVFQGRETGHCTGELHGMKY